MAGKEEAEVMEEAGSPDGTARRRLRLPVINANDTTAVVRRWWVETGSRVEAEETVVEVESTKTVFEVTAPWPGWLESVATVGEDVQTGGTLGWIHSSPETLPAAVETAPPDRERAVAEVLPDRPVTAAARRLARQHGVDPAAVPGRGLLTEKGLRGWLEASSPPRPGTAPATVGASGSARQAGIARSLRQALDTAIPSFIARPVPSAGALAFLDSYSRERRFLVSETDLLLKACGLAWREFPHFKSQADPGEVRIALALDVEGALHTPVLTDPGSRSLEEIAHWRLEQQLEVQRGGEPSAAARATFTLSNLIAYGIEFLTPNLAAGQVATLGLGVRGEARSEAGRWMLCLTFDHRILNGADGARFLAALAVHLQRPEGMI